MLNFYKHFAKISFQITIWTLKTAKNNAKKKKSVDNLHPFPNCKSAAPFNPHKNPIVRLQLLLMVTEVVPCILDKLLLRNSFVLNGRDLYEEFCFDDINALRVYNCQLGVYSFICAEGTPFYQHFLHVWSGSQWNIWASPCAWLIVVVKKIMQFSIFLRCNNCMGANS